MKPALFVEVTRKCNHSCTYCGKWRYNGYHTKLGLSSYDKLFNAARTAGLPRINFTGGEPTLVKNIDKIVANAIDIAHSAGMHVHLTTNGTTITQSEKIWTLPLNMIKVNIQSLNREIFKEITGNDLLDRVVDGVDWLVYRRVPVTIHYVVSRASVSGLSDLLEFIDRRGINVKLFQLDTSFSSHDKSSVGLDDLVIRLNKVAAELTSEPTPGLPIRRWKSNAGNSIGLVASGEQKFNPKICGNCSAYPCDFGLYSLSVTPTGFVYPCLTRHNWGEFLDWSSEQAIVDCLSRMSSIIEGGNFGEIT